MGGRRITGAIMALSIAAAPAFAQSLGELARQEEARRSSGSKSVKTLSNADLKPGDTVSPAAIEAPALPANCYMSRSLGRCITADEMIAKSVTGTFTREVAPHEQKWRQDAAQIRSQIERTLASIATLEAVAADQRRAASDRNSAEQALLAARRALTALERSWEKFEIHAGTQRIPRAWLEPLPPLTSRGLQ